MTIIFFGYNNKLHLWFEFEPPYISIGLGVINLVFNVQSINTLMLQLYQMIWQAVLQGTHLQKNE